SRALSRKSARHLPRAMMVAAGGAESTSDISPTISPTPMRATSPNPSALTENSPSSKKIKKFVSSPSRMTTSPSSSHRRFPVRAIHATSASVSNPKMYKTFRIGFSKIPASSAHQLPAGEVREHARRVAELGEAAGLHHLAFDQDDDAVGLADRAQPMRDDDPGDVEGAERRAHDRLRLVVER